MYKKSLFFVVFLVFTLDFFYAQDEQRVDSKTSYAAGVVLGLKFKESGIKFDYDALKEGMEKTIETDNPGMSEDEAISLLQDAYTAAIDRIKAKNLAQSNDFLKQNAKKPGVKTTADGLQYLVIGKPGKGAKPDANSIVSVKYVGTLIDGTEFDHSGDEPVPIPLDRVIPGWTEGIRLMNVGSHFKLFIPPALAYGEDGAGDLIPPNSVLIFDVELVGIKDAVSDTEIIDID